MRTWRKSEAGGIARLFAWLVVTFRWFLVAGWAAVLVAAALWLPATTANADLGGFAPPHSKAIATETTSAKAFGFPVLSRTMLVQRDPEGL
jgi:RND superfamily putative drug exporter